MESKPLKPFDKVPHRWIDPEKLPVIGKLIYYIKDIFYYKLYGNCRYFCQKIFKAYEFALFSWTNYDFDMAYVYQLTHFKLKRLKKNLENGWAVQEEEDMKALRELIKIFQRLGRKDYDRKYYNEHDRKWGKLMSETIPQYDEKGKIKHYKWNTWRNSLKNVSDEVKEQERKEFLECFEKSEADRHKDIDRMAFLLKKHGLTWWD